MEVDVSDPQDAEAFDWDDDDDERGNTAHLARHGIRPAEVEQVYLNGGVFVPNRRRSSDWLLIGRTDGGQVLTLVLEYKVSRRLLRVFTGWPSTAGERRRYL
jgi:uncharacterized DUF497 family protein